jgi:hypothetical protein
MNLKLLGLLCLLLAPALTVAQDNTPLTTTETHLNWTYHPPDPKSGWAAHTLRCTDNTVPAFEPIPPDGEGYYGRICNDVDLFSSTPGFSLGNSFKGSPHGWQIFIPRKSDARIYGAGIKGPSSSTIFCLGVGDCNEDHEMITLGGRTAPSDEGTEGSRLMVMEPDWTYSGTITSDGGIGERIIQTKCPPLKQVTSTRCDAQGVGRYLIEEDTVYSGAAIAVSGNEGYRPSTLTVTPALPASMLSTAVGVLTSPCSVTQTAANTGTSCEFTVKVVAGEFRPNYLVDATGAYHNQAELTAVEGSGTTRKLTMVAHHSIPEGAYLYQGQPYGSSTPSCTGTAVELLANTVDKLKFPVDVVGCTADAAGNSVLDVVLFIAGSTGGMDMGNVVLGTMGVATNLTSDSNGDVTMVTQGEPARYIGQTITIANSKSFSGLCEKVRYSDAGRAITCHQAGAINRRDSSHDTVAISLGTTGSGNSSLVLHRMAEVLDVRNPRTLEVDGSFILEANEMNGAKGTEVEETHYYSQQLQLHFDNMEMHTPYHSLFHIGMTIQLSGHAYGSGDFLPSLAAWEGVNAAPLTDYAGFGGTRLPPDLTNGRGLWQSALHMQYAPGMAAGGALELVGCPATAAGCADPAYRWKATRFAGNQGEFSEDWYPAANSFRMITLSKGDTSVFETTASGFSFDKPVRIVRGADAADAATVGQLPIAASLTTTGGPSDVLSVPGMTPVGHCSLTATNAAAARNLTLTYVAAKSAGSITVAHVGVPGMTYDALCTSY